MVVGGLGPVAAQAGHGAKAAGLPDLEASIGCGLGNGGFEDAGRLVAGDLADHVEQLDVAAVVAHGDAVRHGLHPLAHVSTRDGDAVNLPTAFRWHLISMPWVSGFDALKSR